MIPRREAAVGVAIAAAGAIPAKIALLWTSQRPLDGDEAIVGLMATHIAQGKSHPLFFYGQSYDAGAGILAHLAAFIFSLVGISGLGLKLVALGIWLAVVLVATLAIRRCLNWKAATVTALLVLWAPSSVEWAMKARGGHVLAVLFVMVMLYLAQFPALVKAGCRTEGRARKGEASREAAGRFVQENEFLDQHHPGASRHSSSAEEGNFAVWGGAAIGAAGAAAIWCQPSVFPVAAVIALWISVESLSKRRFPGACAPLLGAAVISVLPLVIVRGATSSWSWQTLTGAPASRNPAMIFNAMVPGIFTPDLDGSIPPEPEWVRGIGYLWLIAAVAALIVLAAAVFRGTITPQLRRTAALLIAATCSAPLATLMVDSDYARPRHMLLFYPLACMAIAFAIEVSGQGKFAAAFLVLSGAAVHLAYIGPPVIHGAGEQEAALPADVVERAIADLDANRVRCVFSESPMLQWNLMFDSRERIAARWTAPKDRWQPYVERVNAAFAAGEPCALLMRNVPYHEPIPRLRSQFVNNPRQFIAFNDSYALLYNPPRQYIARYFPVER
jgi:hypothetical protein